MPPYLQFTTSSALSNGMISSFSGVTDPLEHQPRTPQPSFPSPSPSPRAPPFPQWQSTHSTPQQLGAWGDPPAQLWRSKLLLICVAASTGHAPAPAWLIRNPLFRVCSVRRRGGWKRDGGMENNRGHEGWRVEMKIEMLTKVVKEIWKSSPSIFATSASWSQRCKWTYSVVLSIILNIIPS